MRRLLAASALVALVAFARPALAHDWNDRQISWQPFDAGLALARKTHKPILLVVFTEWCPHCRNYSRLFHDPRVVAAARDFVMIHVDKDKEPQVSARFAPDGEYIPRTYFLTSTGILDPEIHANRERFQYFFDEAHPEPLLAAMKDAKVALTE